MRKMYALTCCLKRSSAMRQGIPMENVTVGCRNVKMKVVPAPVAKPEAYEEKNARLGRELSPHMTIYKTQLTSLLSITHRFTGIACSFYTWAMGLAALTTSFHVAHLVTMIENLELSSTTLLVAKTVLAFPVAYHTCNGFRHLFWYTGRFLKIKEVYATGYVMVVASLILTAYFAML